MIVVGFATGRYIMAQRKLSPQQRSALRRQMSHSLSKGVEQSKILKSISKKYGIAQESARWYLKSIRGAKSNGKAKAKRKSAKRKLKRTASKAAQGGIHSNGKAGRLLDVVKTFSRESLKRALAAKDLIPQWRAQLKKKRLLERVEQKVKEKVRAVTSSVRKLEKKIRKLTVR